MSAVTRTRSRRTGVVNQRGAAVVETAILLPLLLLLLFGIVEFGRFAMVHHSATTAGREATRFGVASGVTANGVPHYADCDAIREAARELAFGITLSDAQITVDYDHGPSTSTFNSCPVGTSTVDPASVVAGDRILVTVSTTFETIVPLMGVFLDGTPITVTDRRSIIFEVSL